VVESNWPGRRVCMCASDSVVRTETPVEPGVGVAETQQDPATESASVQRVAGSADDRPQLQQNTKDQQAFVSGTAVGAQDRPATQSSRQPRPADVRESAAARRDSLLDLDLQTFASLRQHDETVCWTSTSRRSRVCGSTTRQSAGPRPADVRESTAADVRASSSLRRRKSVALQLHF